MKKYTLYELENEILKYIDNNINYEYLEDYIIEYARKNKKSINLDYVKNRIEDIYNIKGIVKITSFNILLDNLLDYFKKIKK